MSRNGSGVYTLNTAGQPVVSATTITSSAFNAAMADIATALTQSICVDGQTPTTGLIPFAVGLKTDILSPFTANGPMSVTAGQLAFPATQNPSANANTLDDYEEGTATATDGSGAGLTLVTTRFAYVKIGSMALCDFTIGYPANASGASAVVSGLPFTFANVGGVGGAFPIYYGSAAGLVLGFPVQNTSTFQILTTAGGAVANSAITGVTLRAQFMLPTV